MNVIEIMKHVKLPFTVLSADMSSMAGMSSGPGGLSGSTFASNANMLMGHDFSKDLVGSSVGGIYNAGTAEKGSNQYGIDTSKFDTSDYQKMLDQLFNPQTYDKGLLSSPFHGDSYKLPQGQNGAGQGHSYETSHESSMGSYASTDMSSSVYSGNSGNYNGGQSQTYNDGQGHTYNGGNVVSSNGGSGQANTGGSGGLVHSPFDTSHFSTGVSNTYSNGAQLSGSSSGSNSGMTVDSPFKISNAEKGDTPFKIDSAGGFSSGSYSNMNSINANSPFKINDGGKGNTPFKINEAGQGASPFKITDSKGGSPFDTSKFFSGNFGTGQNFGGQTFEGGDNSLGQIQYQGSAEKDKNGLDQYGNVDFSKLSGMSGSRTGNQFQSSGSSSTTHKNGLDQFGNVDFSKLSGLSGNAVDLGSSGTNYGNAAGSGSYSQFSGSSYIDYSANKPNINIGVNTGVSQSQFKTPFESDNYNELLGNPFDSSSNFNSNHENFNQPFSQGPAQSGGLRTYQGSQGSAGSAGSAGTARMPSYLGGQTQVSDQGPAGNPFSQGGARMHG